MGALGAALTVLLAGVGALLAVRFLGDVLSPFDPHRARARPV